MGKGAANLSSEVYSFVYDSFGNVTQTKVGSTALVTNTYGSNNGLLQSSTYANGDAIRYQYNNAGLVTGIYQDNDTESLYRTFAWDYSSNGTPRVHKDGVTALKYDYSYDSIGRLIRTDISNSTSNAYVGSTEYGYDVRNNLTSISNDIGGINYLQEYAYYDIGTDNSEAAAKDNLPTQYKALGRYTAYTYNSLNQLTQVATGSANNNITNKYTYTKFDIGETTYYTNQLATEEIEKEKFYFSYDNVGNITAIEKGPFNSTEKSAYRTYTYDELDRLKIETNYTTGLKTTHDYDHLGNITEKVITNASTGANHSKVNYTYSKSPNTGWNYLLTKLTFTDYTNNTTKEENIYYDAIGNPYSYRGAIMGWYGRQMITHSKNGVDSSFTYDADGLRSSKTVAGVKTEYQYVGDKLFYEKRGDGNSFYYFYDSYGKLSAIYHHVNDSKTAYHVVTNAQGDVIALYSWPGYLVASYEYDAWGNIISVKDANGNAITSQTHIAHLNPFRYRSYYYDKDLGLYYLQSRYYDSEIGRFINADRYISTGIGLMGYNMFAYCNNSPNIAKDENGDLLCTILGASIGALTSVVFKSIETDDPEQLKAAAINGAISGAISGAAADILILTGGTAGVFVAAGAIAGGLGSGLGTVAESLYLEEEIDASEVVTNTIIGAGTGAIFNGISPGASSMKETLVKAGSELTTRNVVKTVVKDFTENFGINTITEVISNFVSWFLSLPFESFG